MGKADAIVSRLGGHRDGQRLVEALESPLRRGLEELGLERRPPRRALQRRLRSLAPGILMGSVVTAAGRRRLRVGGVELREARPTPLGALARGLAAGVVGNLAMDWSQTAVYKIRGKETGNWQSWDEAPWRHR